jgi:CRP/FNR family transcriptional regulator, cyclic AMP receptor protein
MDAAVAGKITAFFASYRRADFDKGHIIVHAEEEPAGVFYLITGRVNQYDISPTGAEVVVNIFKPPAFFPISWAMNHTPNHYFFEAATDVTMHMAPPEDVVTFLKDNPDVTFDLLSRVYRGTDGLLRRMAHLMGGDAKSRLVFELLNAAYRFGDPQSDGSVLLPVAESDLAKYAGMARETVNRIMHGLKTEGLVQVTRAGVRIPDTKRLEALLGVDL